MAIPKHASVNFQTLKKAFINDDVALIEAKDKDTGKVVHAIIAMQTEKDGQIQMIPFAIMIDGDPFKRLLPPDPDDSTKFLGE